MKNVQQCGSNFKYIKEMKNMNIKDLKHYKLLILIL